MVAAALRHLLAWMGGEERDPEEGELQLCTVMACCQMIIDNQVNGTLIDNRRLQEKAKVSEPDADEVIAASEAPEVWEWRWSIDDGYGWGTTEGYYTDEETLLIKGVIDKRKLISTGRRRT
jgi:hypothetical protein